MKLLICGAGYIAGELLKKFGEVWQVTLLEKDKAQLSALIQQFPTIVKAINGDASSPVVLEDAGLAEQDFVLALTRDDRINLSVARFAKDAGVKNIMSLVYLPEYQPRYQALGVQTVNVTAGLAATIHHFLQDPRIRVIPVAGGQAELLEIEVGAHFNLIGRDLRYIRHQNWRAAGLIRENKLLPPETQTLLQKADRLLILGKTDLFKEVCGLIDCGQPHFPRVYGDALLLGLPPVTPREGEYILNECFHLIKNTKLNAMDIFYEAFENNGVIQKARGPHGFDINTKKIDSQLMPAVLEQSRKRNTGILVLPLMGKPRIDMLTKPTHISLAHTLPCPLLIAKGTSPYERILVPFNGSEMTCSALEVGIDLALQIGAAAVSVIIVREPAFLHSTEKTDWVRDRLTKVRETAHIYKTKIDELVKDGNPVTEITTAAADFNLMVIGSTNKEKLFWEPHVGELLVRKSPCSTLIVTH